MNCNELFAGVEKAYKKMGCPIKAVPRCHPKCHMDVFVDFKRRTITLVCSRCDRTISTIKTKDGKSIW